MSDAPHSPTAGRDPFEPAALGPLRLRNRIVKAATFEGMTRGGLVSDALIEYVARPARGGVGMTTLAYCAVSTEGRTYRHQIWLRPEAVPGLRRLTDAVHAEGAAACLQLGHAGWFANPRASGAKAVAPSRVFSPYGMGFPRGLSLDDGIQVARLLDGDGTLDALQLTGGFTGKTPMFLMRGDVPIAEMVAAERSPLRRLGLRLLAPSIVKPYAFEEAFLLPAARRVRAAVRMPLMLLGGVTQLATLHAALAEGFEFVAMARALLFDPDLVHRYQRAVATESGCTHCNRCMTTMERGGTRCVLRDAAA